MSLEGKRANVGKNNMSHSACNGIFSRKETFVLGIMYKFVLLELGFRFSPSC